MREFSETFYFLLFTFYFKLPTMIKKRCDWVGDNPLYIEYHDKEWGLPVYKDAKLFEFLMLETFQAGLSWITVLKKRENFRQAFDNFDYVKIANYDESKFDKLMHNAGIIRNKLKIKATITNAQAFIKIQKEFGSFSKYIWEFVDNKPIINKWKTIKDVPSKTELSDKLSKDLKDRGFKFVGSTVIYAHMQATGMVNDHTVDCFRYGDIKYD
jgi:DNA-3-methyladenine glycosylase I